MKIIIRLLCWFTPALALAQTEDPGTYVLLDSISVKGVNPDSTHHTDTAHFHFSYAATGIVNNTNSLHSYILNNAFKASLSKQSVTVNFSNSWIYGAQNNVLTNNDFSSSLDCDLYKTLQHFYYWGMVNYTTSVSLLINHQEQVGLGPGYNLIDKKKAILILTDGVLYEKGDLLDSLYGGPNGNILQRDQYQAVRNSFRLLYHWVIRDKYTLDGTGFVQNSLSNWSGDYILKLNASVSIKLYKWLSFTTTVVYNKFTRTRSENTQLNFGLTAQH